MSTEVELDPPSAVINALKTSDPDTETLLNKDDNRRAEDTNFIVQVFGYTSRLDSSFRFDWTLPATCYILTPHSET